jgi:hypothetical protein
MRNRFIFRATCVLLSALALAFGEQAHAASPEPGDSTYRSLRYNDDFSNTSRQRNANDFWRTVKFIPIADGPFGPTWLSLGGELRERSEFNLNPNFGIKAPSSSTYGLHRLLLNADLHATNYLRMFAQLGEMERLGNRGIATATDINHFDIMQAFVDLIPPSPLSDSPVVRVGREELLFGFQRLIAVREGPNVRRDFDGVRFNDHWGNTTIDLLAVRPVTDGQGLTDDRANQAQMLWGGYLTLPLGAALKADLYFLNYENTLAKYRGLSGVEHRRTFGVRLFGEADGFDWNAEAAWQTGTFRNLDIRAGMGAIIVGYTFRDTAWRPRIGLEANTASGDNSRSSAIGTFNAMFPRLPYFGETSLLVPANVFDIRPVLSVTPRPGLTATFGWDTLWRASRSDGLYGSGMAMYANTNKVTGSGIGTELSVDVRWRIDQHLTTGAILAEFMAGPAIQQAVGKNVTFSVLFATYRF